MLWKLGIIGFGNVGQGLIRVLYKKQEWLKKRFGFEIEVMTIIDPIKGSVYDEHGVNLKKIIMLLDAKGNIKDYTNTVKEYDSIEMIKNTDTNIIAEITPTNIKTGEPGLSHIKVALESKKHVVTTNKGPIALAYSELKKLAEKNRVALRFEGTILSGTPLISLALEGLAGCNIMKIEGIVNGTTNYILMRMEQGINYDEALKEAQKLGYAEADPSGDVEGWDAAVKAVIMSNVIMGGNIKISDVEREGISHITIETVKNAIKNNNRIKLIAETWKEDQVIKAKVSPKEIPITHPLANIGGTTNALTFTTDHLQDVTIIGPGAGRIETGQALLNDMLTIHKMFTLSQKK